MKLKVWGRRLLLTGLGIYLIGYLLLFFGQQLFIFHPHVLDRNYEYQFDGNWEEHWLKAKDGTELNGLLFKGPSPKGVVLFLHGNTGNIDRCSVVRERFLRNQQDVFFLDYRAFGKSQGNLEFEGMLSDVEAAYNFLAQRYAPSQITVYGQSLGSGMATWLAARHRPKMLILEAPYTSIADLASELFFMYPVDWILNYPFSSKSHIDKVNCPVWVFHGTSDGTIPYAHGKEVSEMAHEGTLITLKDAGHVNLSRFDLYHETLDFILQKP